MTRSLFFACCAAVEIVSFSFFYRILFGGKNEKTIDELFKRAKKTRSNGIRSFETVSYLVMGVQLRFSFTEFEDGIPMEWSLNYFLSCVNAQNNYGKHIIFLTEWPNPISNFIFLIANCVITNV